jgi:cyclopropane fatty-acyl-phospholipid synthase-like methyltransferase
MFELRYIVGNTPWDTGESPPELLDFLRENHAGRALDLGCGTGTNAITINNFGWDVIGVDSSYFAIRRAIEKTMCQAREVDFRRLDVSHLKGIEGPFDLILDIGCFHSLSSTARARYTQRVNQLIAPEGTYMLYTWLGDADSASPQAPTQEEISRSFKPIFTSIDSKVGTEKERASAWFWMNKKST